MGEMKKNNLRFGATVLHIKNNLHCILKNTFCLNEKNPGGEIDKLKDQVIYITKLSKVFIPVSNFIVFPFMARTTKRPAFVNNKQEINYLIKVKLSMLLSKNSIVISKISKRFRW